MLIADLSPYSYGGEPRPGRLAIGWLDPDHPFDRGEVGPPLIQERLEAVLRWAAVHRSVDTFRGRHACSLDGCTAGGSREAQFETAAYGDDERVLGNAQIEVDDGNGTSFVAPNLVVHYIEEHGYRPPPGFVRAALVGEWRRQDRTPGALRLMGEGIPIDAWSPELAAVLWDHLAASLGVSIDEGRARVGIEVCHGEISCLHTRAGLPCVVVVIAPTGTTWVKSSQWLPTKAGTEQLARWIADALPRSER